MGEFNLLQTYPKAIRDVAARLADKEKNRRIALEFGMEYFDGTREQGYGGYVYDGRWIPIARAILDRYHLGPGDRVLDIGCAKGFLMKDLLDCCAGLEVRGLPAGADSVLQSGYSTGCNQGIFRAISGSGNHTVGR